MQPSRGAWVRGVSLQAEAIHPVRGQRAWINEAYLASIADEIRHRSPTAGKQ